MGSADIVVLDSESTASVLDIKTTHSWKWKMMFGRTSREPKPSRMYELQLGTYALGIVEQEDIEYDNISLYLVYYKKDDSMMKSISVNRVWMDNAAEYWESLNQTLDMVESEEDLPRGSLNVPIEDWECRYCQFEPICN
jgi:predicted RecB family nuclease